MERVNEKAGLSPGKHQQKSARKIDASKAKRKLFQDTTHAKKRRKQLKQEASSTRITKEVREGPSYGSNIAMLQRTELEDITIPEPVETPRLELIEAIHEKKVIVFDLETTSLFDDCEIVQLSQLQPLIKVTITTPIYYPNKTLFRVHLKKQVLSNIEANYL